jgi:dissimilatory sulfite reductase (desulfoviridin) alpha/beta subunit
MISLGNELKKSLTVLIPHGLVPAAILNTINGLVEKYSLQIYLSTAQNLRLLNIKAEDEEAIKKALSQAGAEFKGPGKFPLAKVCVGLGYCKLGIVDTFALSKKITEKFGVRTGVKPKFKIAISGCPACCANSINTDIGIKATQMGYELFVGGKGGALPRNGRRIAKGVNESQLFDMIEKVVDFHDQNTAKKQRFAKLIDMPGFPYPAA